jgi:hypothetical protein
MLSRLSILSCSLVGFALAHSDRCAAQVCPNLDYSLATKQIGIEPWCATSGDVNGDGAADILVGRSPLFTNGGVSLLLNAGKGLFPTTTVIPGVSSARALALGDLDLDGDLDLVVSDQGVLGSSGFDNDGVGVFLNDGQGHFTALPLFAFGAGDDEPEGLGLGDLDGDGDLDVAVVIRYHPTSPLTADGRVLVYLNDGRGNLAGPRAFPAGNKPGNIVLADLNGDGALDYATLNSGTNNVAVVFGHGDGTFDAAAAMYIAGLYPAGFTSGDFDGDGDVDLVAGWKYGLRVLVNQGSGTFVGGPTQLFSYYNKAMAAGDFNQDGKLDLVATFATSGDVKFLAGDGNGGFSVYRAYAAGAQVYALTTGDWNGDAILDAATADNDVSDVRIWSSECGSWIYCTSKTNSLGCVPQIGFTGAPSASAGSGFLVTATNLYNNKSGLLFYSTNGRVALPFLGGTLCVATPIRRTGSQSSGGTPVGADCTGHFSFDFNAWIAGGVDPLLLAGTRVDVQYYSRDPGFPAPNNVGLTNALEFTIGL